MIKEAIVKIVNKEDLTYEEAYAVMNEIMSGQTSATQNAAFLAALSTKSARAETTDEIAGCAAAMRAHATQVDTGLEVFEIVGTGGDNAHSFNISTTSALVAAAGGMKVAKHGNRAASSQCGTADCLEALGVNISQSPARCRELLAPGIHAVGVFDRKLSGQVRRPYFLAGGLIPENSGEAIRQPAPYWVDISSGIETDGYFCSVHQNTASILKAA